MLVTTGTGAGFFSHPGCLVETRSRALLQGVYLGEVEGGMVLSLEGSTLTSSP